MFTRRDLIVHSAALAAAAAAGSAGAATGAFTDADYRRAIVINGLGGVDDPYSAADATVFSPRAIAEFKESGLTVSTFTVNELGSRPDAWEKTVSQISETDQLLADNPGLLVKVFTAADIRRAKQEGKAAILYNVQDTAMMAADLDRVAQIKGLGVRVVQLTYNLRNLCGDGSLEPGNAGLSKFGHAMIARIEKERLLLDLSHGGQRTIAEAIAAATRPPIISHTGCRSLHDNPRNVWDAEMKACADKGGVVGVYWMPFLVPNSKPTGADLVRHMQHVQNLCGEDHVSIGTDGGLGKTVLNDAARAGQKKFYDDRAARGIAAPGEGPDIFNIVAEWDDHMRFRHLADGLSRAGWSTTQIEKALGGNLLRVYGEVLG